MWLSFRHAMLLPYRGSPMVDDGYGNLVEVPFGGIAIHRPRG